VQISNTSQQPCGTSICKKQDNVNNRRDNPKAAQQAAQVGITRETIEVRAGHDLTQMTSGDMLALASSFHREGNIQDFLTLAVFSAQAALEDHPDELVQHTWQTSRNENGTFNLLAEIQARASNSTGIPEYEDQRQTDRKHLLETLLSIPTSVTKIERTTIDIMQ